MNIKNNDLVQDLSFSVETGLFYWVNGAGKLVEFSPPVSAASLGYTEYVANLSQAGEDIPTARVGNNTIDDSAIYTRTNAGIYVLTFGANFTDQTKVVVFFGNKVADGTAVYPSYMVGANTITITTADLDDPLIGVADDLLDSTAIMIREYL